MENISKALPEDIPQLVRLVNSAYKGKDSVPGWTSESHLMDGPRTDEESLLSSMSEKDAIFLKYSLDTQHIAGCVYLKVSGNRMYLGMLSVLPSYQDRGIGKKLISAGESLAKSLQCTLMEMTVISRRTDLLKWYTRQAYLPTGEVRPFPVESAITIPREPLEMLVLQKVLS